ncbi:hypothetical protein [Candidatus Regiella insecticola]|uniref:hypothetical protein n=1 Tax=Candidatus Regiella insecticola TaxID=138073 RepID=UPI00159D1870|nr:hypothetical protein [Candidatus Regiella insecticola]
MNIPTVLQVAFGCQSVRPMSVDRLRDLGEPPQPTTRQLQRRRVYSTLLRCASLSMAHLDRC